MKDVQIDKGTVLEKLIENRETHIEQYSQAVEGYKETVIKTIDKTKREFKKTGKLDASALYRLSEPESHENDYDVSIQMLEMDEREIVTLSRSDFERYVLDEWEWKQRFAATSAQYTSPSLD